MASDSQPSSLIPHPLDRCDLVIRPQTGWFDLHLADLWRYRDLTMLFVWRDFVAQYKQTILGPLWHLLQPLFTTLLFTVIFGRIAQTPHRRPAPDAVLHGRSDGLDLLRRVPQPHLHHLHSKRQHLRQSLFSRGSVFRSRWSSRT